MDARTPLEKAMWDLIGPPLYYCSECLRAVKATNGEIIRKCNCSAQVIAPRKAIAAGEGGLSLPDKIKTTYWQISAALTGRCV